MGGIPISYWTAVLGVVFPTEGLRLSSLLMEPPPYRFSLSMPRTHEPGFAALFEAR